MSEQRTVPMQGCSSGHSGRAERGQTRPPLPRYPNALRACIKRKGYTFREIAAETGIPESTLYDWAAGNRAIPHHMRHRLTHLLGGTISELIPASMVVDTDASGDRMHLAQGLMRQVIALLAPCSCEDIHQLVNQVLVSGDAETSVSLSAIVEEEKR